MAKITEKNLQKLISEFEIWFQADQHSTFETIYDDEINNEYLSNLNKMDFIDYFYKFVSEGGKLGHVLFSV